MTDSRRFFTDLESFSDFEKVGNIKYFKAVPDDWVVILTDIRGSTKLIEAGRYKDVNMVGAACISAAVNSCKDIEIPYVFGGDGATLLVHESDAESVLRQMHAVQSFARKYHDIDLRVGALPVKEVTDAGRSFLIAKYRTKTGRALAMFSGGGASFADELVKQRSHSQTEAEKQQVENIEPDLEGLSCRWKPIKAQNGLMMTMLVCVIESGESETLYAEIYNTIKLIMESDLNPVKTETMEYMWPVGEALRQSQMMWKQGNKFANLLGLVGIILFFRFADAISLKSAKFDVNQYKDDMSHNSDFQKFDDMLRMVMDCSELQAKAIEDYLGTFYQQGKIVFGVHKSDSALMTCFVETLQKDGHVHFIDGNNGGYALAAKDMKDRIKMLKSAA